MAEVDTALGRATTSLADLPEAGDVDNTTALVPSSDGTLAAPEHKKKTKKIIKKKRRPARPQVDPATFKTEPPPQTGTIFNIWYNKWSGGDREDALLSKHQAKGRCNVALDSGFTKADRVVGSYFCLFFARGLCPRGQDCEYLHRLPNSRIEKDGGLGDMFPSNVDCFGRDKFSDYRDDMGGVGSFLRVNRTIYVGRIHVTDDIEEVVARHFQEWGQVERIRVLPARGVAFVTYVHLANAEFAKEAMAHQALDHNETLNVRWATVDPNPAAQKREARKIEEQAAEAIRRALPAEYVAEIEGRGQGWEEARKRRKMEGNFGLEGFQAPDEIWYASEKARIEASQGTMMIEGGEAEDEEEGGAPVRAEDFMKPEEETGGILSGSTLKALKGYGTGSAAPKPAAERPAGPLVGYGSDEESD
ncbi:Pre-mRNA-splicing factor cwc2 [Sphaceloma murrayae]|uniref:Pre-mRNA-splicing factor CWC2 n=1 Tax=Sphaceloma murrayae TaxID=2082308 RepID=A0A2K1QKC7_9PEZI|nr:Pre-mRNA-splicing factor cwc2 [Sphaceloma murrayae]